MLQIFIGTYLVLGIPAALLLLAALAAAKMHDKEEKHNRERFQQTAVVISNSRNPH